MGLLRNPMPAKTGVPIPTSPKTNAQVPWAPPGLHIAASLLRQQGTGSIMAMTGGVPGFPKGNQKMVKLQGPMFSLAASGTIADTVTFSTWKGRPYARERVIPSNPKSGAQVGRRSMFTFLTQNWDAISTAFKATWQSTADDLIASPFNGYLSVNMKDWHNFLAPSQAFPADRLGTPSDNSLTGAVWEENRIKLSFSGTTQGDSWAMIIFAKEGSAVTPAVGNAIITMEDGLVAGYDVYWTPPKVATWHFDSIATSDDGVKATAGGPQNAVPP